MERQKLIITAAALINPDSVRLRIVRAEQFKGGTAAPGAGSREALGTWVEWESAQGRALFKNSGLHAGRGRRLAIPATGALGADMVHDLRIEWEEDFPLKSLLTAHWVMGS